MEQNFQICYDYGDFEGQERVSFKTTYFGPPILNNRLAAGSPPLMVTLFY